jgi:RNA methyltransferase, TrmH family
MIITSRQNAALKNMRRLRRCKAGQALLEGPTLILEALAAGIALEEVLATDDFLAGPAAGEVRAALTAAGLPHGPRRVLPELLEELADTDSPRGLVAVARLPRAGVTTLPRRAGESYLFVEGLQDPGNLGALARTAEAAGIVGMALYPGTVHPNHPRALRASAGSLLRLPVAVGVSPEALQDHLAALANKWVALVPRGGEDLYRAPLEGTLTLTVGAEGPGLSAALRRRADLRLTIPMAPPVESLNATVATALVLFEVRRRRSHSPGPETDGAGAHSQ